MSVLLKILLSACAALLLGACAYNDAYSVSRAYERGRRDARHDLAKGILAVETCGLPISNSGAHRLLRERYGIHVRSVGGCVVNSRLRAHIAGYNELSGAEIEQRFGKDVWDNAREESRNHYSQKQITE